MRSFIIILLAIATTGTAFGRLGDTEQQLKERYGKPVMIRSGEKYNPYFSKLIDYKKQGIAISCGLHEGRCVTITYERDGGFNSMEVEGFTLLNRSKASVLVERSTSSLKYTFKKDYPGIMAGSKKALRRMRKDFESTVPKA
jgi:hypothetical protein